MTASSYNMHPETWDSYVIIIITDVVFFVFVIFLQHVDYENSTICGYLKIQGLTDVGCLLWIMKIIVVRISSLYQQEYPTLTTFFEGEIISERYPFLTRKWDASEEVDRKHWGKFPTFEPYLKTFNADDFSYDKLKQSDEVFMRWKVFNACLYLCLFSMPKLFLLTAHFSLSTRYASCVHS